MRSREGDEPRALRQILHRSARGCGEIHGQRRTAVSTITALPGARSPERIWVLRPSLRPILRSRGTGLEFSRTQTRPTSSPVFDGTSGGAEASLGRRREAQRAVGHQDRVLGLRDKDVDGRGEAGTQQAGTRCRPEARLDRSRRRWWSSARCAATRGSRRTGAAETHRRRTSPSGLREPDRYRLRRYRLRAPCGRGRSRA